MVGIPPRSGLRPDARSRDRDDLLDRVRRVGREALLEIEEVTAAPAHLFSRHRILLFTLVDPRRDDRPGPGSDFGGHLGADDCLLWDFLLRQGSFFRFRGNSQYVTPRARSMMRC